MARLVGIDVRSSHVRVALLQTQYRGTKLLGWREIPLNSQSEVEGALQVVGLPLVQAGDHIATLVSGDQTFIRDIDLPSAASRQLDDVVPYEIEAQVPLDMDELCFDYRLLKKKAGDEGLKVLAAATRISAVSRQIAIVQNALGVEPERVGAGPLVLANLAVVSPELQGAEPVAVLDIGLGSSDLVVLRDGYPVFARTLSVGAEAGADALVAALRQSQASWLSRGEGAFVRMYLVGAGPAIEGAAPALSQALGLSVAPLPPLPIEVLGEPGGATPVGFEKAIALALGLSSGSRDLNLRQGALEYHHSYEFIKTKLPLVAGVAALIVASFAFSVWARGRSLAAENASLEVALSALSESVFGERLDDADAIIERLDRGGAGGETDPQGELDAFDVLVEVSSAIDPDIVHDIDEFDVQGANVKIRGIVSTVEEAEQITKAIGQRRCFKEAKRGKIMNVVKSTRKKYSLTFEVQCDSDLAQKSSKTAAKGGR